MKRSQPDRDWRDASAKLEQELFCRLCGAGNPQRAHVIGRRADVPKEGRSTLWVNPDSIVPLCDSCHRTYDAHAVDLLGQLTAREAAQAVLDASRIYGGNGLEAMRKRTCPLAYREAA